MSETQHIDTSGSSVDIEAYSDESGQAFVEITFTATSRMRLLFPLESARTLRDALASAIEATEAGLAAEQAQ